MVRKTKTIGGNLIVEYIGTVVGLETIPSGTVLDYRDSNEGGKFILPMRIPEEYIVGKKIRATQVFSGSYIYGVPKNATLTFYS